MPNIRYLIAANTRKIGLIWLTSLSATISTKISGLPSMLILSTPYLLPFTIGASIGREYSIEDFIN